MWFNQTVVNIWAFHFCSFSFFKKKARQTELVCRHMVLKLFRDMLKSFSILSEFQPWLHCSGAHFPLCWVWYSVWRVMHRKENKRDCRGHARCSHATLLTPVRWQTPWPGGQTTSTAGTDTHRRTGCNFQRNHLLTLRRSCVESLRRELTYSCGVCGSGGVSVFFFFFPYIISGQPPPLHLCHSSPL